MEREFHIWGFTKRLCGVYGGIATGKGHTALPAASPVTLWHGWRGNHHLTDVISRDSFSVVMPLANSANCSPCEDAEPVPEKAYMIV